jgi:GPH family glycoside/pentoside/hexuronide:cation symporter
MQTDLPQPIKLSSKTKFYYGVASLGSATISGIYAALLTIFYQDYLGLGSSWIGMASLIYAIWNAINDPLFGHITDHTKSKLGRRIPYMRFTAPFLALTFILIWFAPPNASQMVQFLWMLITMLLYDTCYTIIGLVHGALMPEITESDTERTQLNISSTLFGLTGTVLGFILPDLFRPKEVSTSSNMLTLQMALVAIALIAAFLIILTTLHVKERKEFSAVDKPLKLWPSLKYTFTSKSFLIFVSMNFMGTLMMSMSMGAIYYLADYVTQSSATVMMAFIFIPMALGVPLTRLAIKWWGVAASQQIYLVISGLSLCSLAVLPVKWIPYGLVAAGFGMSGMQTITYLLLGQVIDEDEVRTGVRREGAFYGANALVTKPAQSIAMGLTAFILETSGFVTREANNNTIFLDQNASALFGIRSIVGLIPGIALLIGAVILIWYPLKGNYLKQVKDKILVMHAEKHARYEAMQQEQRPVT